MDPLVVVIMGSRSDLEHARQIRSALAEFDVRCEFRIASAHKSVGHLLRLLAQYESQDRPLVYIAVAGRSNALGGLVDAQTARCNRVAVFLRNKSVKAACSRRSSPVIDQEI